MLIESIYGEKPPGCPADPHSALCLASDGRSKYPYVAPRGACRCQVVLLRANIEELPRFLGCVL